MRAILFVLSFLCSGSLLIASNIVEVLPLRDNILMIHFDDGYVIHHTAGQSPNDESVVSDPLDTDLASLTSSYIITSQDDLAFQMGLQPLLVYRKSKATDFANLCQGWDNGCINVDKDHASEHWIYLQLPAVLTSGKTYQIQIAGYDTATYLHNDMQQRSEAVHVNMIGYVGAAPEKYGYVYHWMGDGGSMPFDGLAGNDVQVINTADNTVAFTSELVFRKPIENQEIAYVEESPPSGNLLGAEVYECDFSSFAVPGSYRLCIKGVGCSFEFEIKDDVYLEPWASVQNGLYQQRSGIALTAPYTDQERPAPHNTEETPGFAGQLYYTTYRFPDHVDADYSEEDLAPTEAGILGTIDVSGWYQDAGDWDGYYYHTDVPTKLLWLFEFNADKYGDGQLNIPENTNGTPDLLDEGLWLPRFYYRLREAMKASGYGTGGVGGGRIYGDLYGDDRGEEELARGSWQDTDRKWIITGEDPFITYKYAALAAQIAYIIEVRDIDLSDNIDWKAEAMSAYEWAAANTLDTDESLFSVTPLYAVRFNAAAQLYRLTNEDPYKAVAESDFQLIPASEPLTDESLFAVSAYLKATGADANIRSAMLQKLYEQADFEMNAFRDDRACRWGGNFYFPLLAGQPTTPYVMSGVVGHHFAAAEGDLDKAESYRAALYSTADYFLGNNPLNTTWITRLGERHPNDLLHLDSWILGGDTPRSGIVPYGPWTLSQGLGPSGPWNHQWAFNFLYPEDAVDWPAHERYFDQRTSPLSNEFTVHQNLANTIFSFGYLYALTAADITSSVREIAHDIDLQVSPNPAHNQVAISIHNQDSDHKYELSTLTGQVLFAGPISGSISLDISALSRGIYIVSFFSKNNSKTVSRKLVKTK